MKILLQTIKARFKKIIKTILLILLGFLIIAASYLFIGKPPRAKEIIWGVTFSQKYATDLKLDWKEVYLAILDDLKVKNLRLVAYWDLIEPDYNPPTALPAEGWAPEKNYHFEDLDWQVKEAEKREAKIILVIGMKVPRWPECHIPSWAENLDKKEQQERILKLIEKIVLNYRDSTSIEMWQVENEPFLGFGQCPWYDKEFFLKEVELVRRLDSKRPIIVTESGELSFWFGAAKTGDVVGTTLYRQTWWHKAGGFYIRYPLLPVHYWRKAQIIKWLFDKEVINVELQVEPWGPVPVYHGLSLEEQEKSMNLKKFRENIEYAKRTGLKTFYLWGAEWWYWLKVKHNNPDIWNAARELFITPENL